MRPKTPIGLGVAIVLLSCTCVAGATSIEAPCRDDLTRSIPDRPHDAPTGSEFVAQVAATDDDEREARILTTLLAGNMPAFLRQLQPVHLQGPGGAPTDVTVCVFPDYLAVGSDENFFLAPMRLQTALSIANRFHFTLPTRRIVDAVYIQATMHLQPQPLPASDAMRSTAYYSQHNDLVREQRVALTGDLGFLTAGDKKDLVLTNRLWSNPGRVAIYGWHRPDGNPIQPLSTVHGIRYADYSHGVRLVSDTAYVGGKATPLLALLQDRQTAAALSDEGEIRNALGLLEHLRSEPLPHARTTSGSRN
jgi:hypothetical protein